MQAETTTQSRSLPAIRRDLAQARADLRQAQDDHNLVRACAEQRAIDAAGGDEKKLGANETARNRALTIALAADGDYLAVQRRLREMEATIDRLDAEIESARDERRKAEWEIRLRLAEALDKRGVSSDEPRSNGNDHAFDDAATATATSTVANAAQRQRDELEQGFNQALTDMGLAEDDSESPFG